MKRYLIPFLLLVFFTVPVHAQSLSKGSTICLQRILLEDLTEALKGGDKSRALKISQMGCFYAKQSIPIVSYSNTGDQIIDVIVNNQGKHMHVFSYNFSLQN